MKQIINLPIVTVFVLTFLPPASASPVTISGSFKFIFTEASGTYDSITITLSQGTFDTGPIQYTLNTADPNANYAIVNFDTDTIETHTDLLLDSPLLAALGQPPQAFHVDEVGPFTFSPADLPDGTTAELELDPILTGNGFFAPGQLLSDWTYSNPKRPVVTGPTVRQGKNGAVIIGGTVKFKNDSDPKDPPKLKSPPNGTIPHQEIPLNGGGTGRATEPLPEPSTMLLVPAFFIGLAWRARSRRLANTADRN